MTPGSGYYHHIYFTGEQAEHRVAEKLARRHTAIEFESRQSAHRLCVENVGKAIFTVAAVAAGPLGTKVGERQGEP